ncbi:hypothetical protein [Gordoniibacillus kamchatkensis]|nr:hypothetical protein [Paenibacillus sp. VKM B-2647]
MAVNSPIYSYFLVNRHWISIPDSKEMAVIRIVYTEVLSPLLLTWVLDEVLVQKRFSVRAACYAATLALIFLGGWLLDRWGVVKFRGNGLLLYTPIKSITLIAALCSARLVRYLMRKDGIGHGQISRS